MTPITKGHVDDVAEQNGGLVNALIWATVAAFTGILAYVAGLLKLPKRKTANGAVIASPSHLEELSKIADKLDGMVKSFKDLVQHEMARDRAVVEGYHKRISKLEGDSGYQDAQIIGLRLELTQAQRDIIELRNKQSSYGERITTVEERTRRL